MDNYFSAIHFASWKSSDGEIWEEHELYPIRYSIWYNVLHKQNIFVYVDFFLYFCIWYLQTGDSQGPKEAIEFELLAGHLDESVFLICKRCIYVKFYISKKNWSQIS